MLFAEPPGHKAPEGVYLAEIDGASRGNPGPSSYAVIVRAPDGAVEWRTGKFLGRNTNNVAEYYALLAALDFAASRHLNRLRIRSDSELLVRQMHGRYKVKSADLRPLHERAMKLARALEFFVIEHVRREQNRDADRLANEALDGGAASSLPLAASARALPETETKKSRRKRPNAAARAMRIRATYLRGALLPEASLDLRDGDEVEIIIYACDKTPIKTS
jgi:ribonuclease HI